MAKFLIRGGLATAVLAFASFTPASAFVPNQAEIVRAADVTSDTVLVKRHKTARPPGWNRGRKVGWRGGRKPPGQRR
jgi:hypothetical protein